MSAVRTIPTYLVTKGDQVDRKLLAPLFGIDPDEVEVGEIDTVVVDHGRGTLIFVDDEVWGGLRYDDNVPVLVKEI